MKKKKKFKVPKVLNVGENSIKIELVSDFPENLYGTYSYADKTIRINKNNHKSQSEINKTLIHEYLHALFHITGLNFSVFGIDLELHKEEAVVLLIQNMLLPFAYKYKNYK